MNRLSSCFGALIFVATAVEAQDATDPVLASLVTESSAVSPDATVRLGLRLQHAPHWHTYWRNPGDSGLPTRLRWTLPTGYSIDEIAWPTPTRFDVGGLYNFGYTDDMLLPVALHVPADAKPGDKATLTADASWLMCREECVPGKAQLSVTVSIGAKSAPAEAAIAPLFAKASTHSPQRVDWQAQAALSGETLIVTLHGNALPSPEGLDAFVEERKLVGYAPPKIAASADGLTLTFPKSDYFTDAPAQVNLLLVRSAATPVSWHVTAPLSPP